MIYLQEFGREKIIYLFLPVGDLLTTKIILSIYDLTRIPLRYILDNEIFKTNEL